MAQESPADSLRPDILLRVYLDCQACDDDFVRQQISIVDFVRDRFDADLHLIISSQPAGGGGEYTLQFVGRKRYESIGDTLRFLSSDTYSEFEERAGLLRMINLGLARYLARSPRAHHIDIDYRSVPRSEMEYDSSLSKWNFWVFSTGLSGSYNAEESTSFIRASGVVSAKRVTDLWKIILSTNGTYRESRFELGEETVTSTSRDASFRALMVKSLGSKWGVGIFSSATTSSFTNTDLSASLSLAVERNLFPYLESASREFRISYFLAFRAFDYESETVFDKTSEYLLQQSLETAVASRQPWGSAQLSMVISQYVTDFSRSLLDLYSVQLFGFVELRLGRGLSVVATSRASRIRDQLFLSKKSVENEEILLQSRQLPTTFEYGFSLGLRYTFGSIYNNFVNSRFGPQN